LFWGSSAGGGFAYNFANWKAERVAAFVLVKSAANTEDARPSLLKVPGMFAVGEKDNADRNELIKQRYTAGQRRGALWCYAFEPNGEHGAGLAGALGQTFLRDVIAYRAALAGVGSPDISWVGSLENHEIFAKGKQPSNIKNTTWLPNEAFANAWKTFATGGKTNE